MKKRLLITSIVMMLVVAVALGTSTYAWFTSSNAVTADQITLYAAINQDSALEISYTNTESTSNWLTHIGAVTPNEAETENPYKFNPSAPIITANPATLSVHGVSTTGTFFSALDWKTSKIINSRFKDAGTGNERYVWTDGTGEGKGHTTIFLHNGSTANPISNINITATVTGEAQSFIRIAVFKKIVGGANDGEFELYGILSNGYIFEKAVLSAWTAQTLYYTSTADNAVGTTMTEEDLGTALASGMVYTRSATTSVAVAVHAFNYNDVYTNIINDQNICTESIALGGLGVNNKAAGGTDEMELKIVVWMDGSALNDDTASTTSKVSSVSLSFTVGDPA